MKVLVRAVLSLTGRGICRCKDGSGFQQGGVREGGGHSPLRAVRCAAPAVGPAGVVRGEGQHRGHPGGEGTGHPEVCGRQRRAAADARGPGGLE